MVLSAPCVRVSCHCTASRSTWWSSARLALKPKLKKKDWAQHMWV